MRLQGGFLAWLIKKIPNRLLAEPERYALAVSFFILGWNTIFRGPPAHTHSATILNLEIGVSLVAGGAFKLYGLSLRKVWSTRLGAAFLILGCLGVILDAIFYAKGPSVPVAFMFGLFAATYSLRLLQSTAARVKLHRGAPE